MIGPTFVDVNIPMYAAGREHPLRAPAQRIIRALVAGDFDGVTDAEVFQEILYRYLRSGERDRGLALFDRFYRIMEGRILAVTSADVLNARGLSEAYPSLSPRDLIHLAVMQGHGIRVIVTADVHFDGIDGITRWDPLTSA